MANINLVRGDTATVSVTVNNENATPYDLTDSVIRMAVKIRASDPNASSLIFKTSYDSEEILITDAVNGLAKIDFLTRDTIDLDNGSFFWDLDITRPLSLVQPLTVSVTAGSDIVTVTSGFNAELIRVGYMIRLNGSGTNIGYKVITSVNTGTNQITTEGFSDYTTATGVSASCYSATRKTPAGLSGSFILTADVVR